MSAELLFFLSIFSIAAGGVLSLAVKPVMKAAVNVFFSAAAFLFFLYPLYKIFAMNGSVRASLTPNTLFGTVPIVIDPLSAFFVFIILLFTLLGSIYSAGYMGIYRNGGRSKMISGYYFFSSILALSMILVVTLQNIIAFSLAWELMSLSSFFLVIFDYEDAKNTRAGIYYLVSMHLCLAVIISGFLFLSSKTGDFTLVSFKKYFDNNKTMTDVLFLVFFAGFGIKAGFFPFHSWLPRAHPAAPGPVSAMMSGVMIKTGIYGILRMLTLTGAPSPAVSYIVLFSAILSCIFGSLYSMAQKDLKRSLAYCSIENIGIIGLGIGTGMLGMTFGNGLMATLGMTGALLHILNHALFKTQLFFAAGSVYRQTHTRDMEKLGGLAGSMPLTSSMYLTGSAAVSGLPPLNGFTSEFLIYMGLISGLSVFKPGTSIVLILLIAGLALTGALTLLGFTRSMSTVFLGTNRSTPPLKALETPLIMIIPQVLITLIMLFIGLFPRYAVDLLKPAVINLTGQALFGGSGRIIAVLASVSRIFLIFTGITALLWIVRVLLPGRKLERRAPSWGCAYPQTPRMQYTASSFSDPVLQVVSRAVGLKKEYVLPAGIFPGKSSIISGTEDILDRYVIEPGVKLINRVLGLFTWIQSGKTQNYLIYGLVFLLVALFLVMGAGL
ncbi:MAG: proton-conducting transporter membrane subunit [Brevinematales bacterium]